MSDILKRDVALKRGYYSSDCCEFRGQKWVNGRYENKFYHLKIMLDSKFDYLQKVLLGWE